MKKLLLLFFALCIGLGAWAQSSKKKTKNEEKENTEQTGHDSTKSVKKSVKDKKDKESKDESKKTNKQPSKQEPVKKTPEKKTTTTKPGNNKPVPVNVVNYYYELPAEALPQIGAYIKRRKEEAPLVKTVDNADLRKGFILDKDAERGYLNLQLPNENKYTRLQLYKQGNTPLLAVEVTECKPHCDNQLTIYRRDTGQWRDVTSEYLPPLDLKFIRKRLQEKYKEEYMDLDVYESKGYDDETMLRNELMYVIATDENKIFVREEGLSINLYEMTWDAEKNKFVLKKL
jgi:preprotein translocase subunit SecG